MDARAAKLALARKKLKDHQDKKLVYHKDGNPNDPSEILTQENSETSKPNEKDLTNNTECITVNDQTEKLLVKQQDLNLNPGPHLEPSDLNVTEILISNKRMLELNVIELQSKLTQLENDHAATTSNYNISKQQICSLEKELKNMNDKYALLVEEILSKDELIQQHQTAKNTLLDENNNLQDQLEFTKTVLTAKETENDSLHSQLYKLQSQLDAMHLHLQQITNGSADYITQCNGDQENHQNGVLQQKIIALEQQIKLLQKERDQISSHFEHYVGELNEQLKSASLKNEELTREIQNLANRESSLIDQISEMEIRFQNLHSFKEAVENKSKDNDQFNELQDNLEKSQEMFKELGMRYEELEKKFSASEAKVLELSHVKETECTHGEISYSKLNADITSDKIAAQRATEQNKKLKTNVQDLEDAFIKLSQDKLELVEKITAEKYLNRELTIKLAEIEEKSKEMHIKLMAKDEEMIRLQTNCREIERKMEHLLQAQPTQYNEVNVIDNHEDELEESLQRHDHNDHESHNNCNNHRNDTKETDSEIPSKTSNSPIIPKEDAMCKLQERFLKIMGEVADLSDEKHRLEHIILQLQNETDTICEYVALYQQQRSLLKKRDEERSAQIKIFQAECDSLRMQLDELRSILIRFAGDAKLTTYFQEEAKQADMAKVMDLLTHLQQNSLIDPQKISLDLNNFYPCSCCSGQLIDV